MKDTRSRKANADSKTWDRNVLDPIHEHQEQKRRLIPPQSRAHLMNQFELLWLMKTLIHLMLPQRLQYLMNLVIQVRPQQDHMKREPHVDQTQSKESAEHGRTQHQAQQDYPTGLGSMSNQAFAT